MLKKSCLFLFSCSSSQYVYWNQKTVLSIYKRFQHIDSKLPPPTGVLYHHNPFDLTNAHTAKPLFPVHQLNLRIPVRLVNRSAQQPVLYYRAKNKRALLSICVRNL